jgi:hypothetical protein
MIFVGNNHRSRGLAIFRESGTGCSIIEVCFSINNTVCGARRSGNRYPLTLRTSATWPPIQESRSAAAGKQGCCLSFMTFL